MLLTLGGQTAIVGATGINSYPPTGLVLDYRDATLATVADTEEMESARLDALTDDPYHTVCEIAQGAPVTSPQFSPVHAEEASEGATKCSRFDDFIIELRVSFQAWLPKLVGTGKEWRTVYAGGTLPLPSVFAGAEDVAATVGYAETPYAFGDAALDALHRTMYEIVSPIYLASGKPYTKWSPTYYMAMIL